MVDDLVAYFETLTPPMDKKQSMSGRNTTRKSLREAKPGRVKKIVNEFTEIKRPSGKTRKLAENAETDERVRSLPRTKKEKDSSEEYYKMYAKINKNHVNQLGKVAETSSSHKVEKTIIYEDPEISQKVEEFGEKLKKRRSLLLSKSSLQEDDKEGEINNNTTTKIIRRVSFKEPNTEEREEKVFSDDSVNEINNHESSIPSRSDETDCSKESFDEDIFGSNDFEENSEDNYIVEAYNKDGEELVILTLQITRRSLGSNEMGDHINNLIKDSDSDFVYLNKESQTDSDFGNQLIEVTSYEDSVFSDDDIENKGYSDKFEKYLRSISTIHDDSDISQKSEIQEENLSTESDEVTSNGKINSQNREESELTTQDTFEARKRYFQNFELREQGDNFYYQYPDNETFTLKMFNGQLSKSEPASPSLQRKDRTNYVIEELLKTERGYIDILQIVVEKYIPYLQRCKRPDLLGKSAYLFGNIETIYQNARIFYAKLKNNCDTVDGIAQVFIDSASIFDLYPKYSKNKPTADLYIKEFDSVIKERQKSLDDKLGLASHLLTPIQRLGKYMLMLENIQKELNKNNNSSEKINLAINIIRQVMRKGNDSIAIDSIKNCPLDLALNGSFIMRANFTILKPKKLQSVVFLFDQVIVFTQKFAKNMEQFNYVDSIYMSQLTIAKYEDKECIFHLIDFLRTKKYGPEQATFVLEAESPKSKLEWTRAIEAKLWEQLEQAKKEQKRLNSDEGKRFSKVSLPSSPVQLRSRKKSKPLKPTSKFYEQV